jgi:uncharacterized protein with PQ loop repeat
MRRDILKQLSFFVFFIFILNTLATFFGWYTIFSWFDNMMHFLGGAWLALVTTWLWYTKYKRGIWGIGSILIFVFIGAFLWEILEYLIQFLARSPDSLATLPDSVSDIIFGLLGGLLVGYRKIKTIKRQQ